MGGVEDGVMTERDDERPGERPLSMKHTRVFSWPLSKDVSAEVRVTGPDVRPAHLERLRHYLDLAKDAPAADDGDG